MGDFNGYQDNGDTDAERKQLRSVLIIAAFIIVCVGVIVWGLGKLVGLL